MHFPIAWRCTTGLNSRTCVLEAPSVMREVFTGRTGQVVSPSQVACRLALFDLSAAYDIAIIVNFYYINQSLTIPVSSLVADFERRRILRP
jgi:hypothetical protein